MKHLSFLSSAFLFSCITLACNYNSSVTNDKNDPHSNSSANSVSAGRSDGDMYYEYKLSTKSNAKSSEKMDIQSSSKIYISSKGDVRSEMTTAISYNGKNSTTTDVTIGHADKPDESIVIDSDTKTYSVMHFNDSELSPDLKVQILSVTNEGSEKIIGFNSVHAKIISKKFAGTYLEEVDTMDIWRSKDVPMVASVKALWEKYEDKNGSGLFTPDVVSQLKQMGCEGFMTKMEIHSKISSVIETLVKVEPRDLPASLFEIPAGYSEDKK